MKNLKHAAPLALATILPVLVLLALGAGREHERACVGIVVRDEPDAVVGAPTTAVYRAWSDGEIEVLRNVKPGKPGAWERVN
jgi:hypothetical protein